MAVKRVPVADILAGGGTVTVTVGRGATAPNGQGGTSSFGAFCSATGGNSGQSTAATGGASGNGIGGMGIGGDVNRRGGRGGLGRLDSGSGHGGGGGSAPAPCGHKDGFAGGNSSSFGGGGGGGIGQKGGYCGGNYSAGGGGGSAGASVEWQSHPTTARAWRYGLLGAGGRAARRLQQRYGSDGAESASGGAILTPNMILFAAAAAVLGVWM